MMVPSGLKLLWEMSKLKVHNDDFISNIVSNDFEIPNLRSSDTQKNVGMNSDLEDSSNEIDIKIEIKDEPVDESEEIIGI